MRFVLIQRNPQPEHGRPEGLLGLALSAQPLASLVSEELAETEHPFAACPATYLLPQRWRNLIKAPHEKVVFYQQDNSVDINDLVEAPDDWIIISNGRFATTVTPELAQHALESAKKADVVAITVSPYLRAACEKTRLTAGSEVAGFRRLYTDAIEPGPFPQHWPHHLLIATRHLDSLLDRTGLPTAFSTLSARIRSSGLTTLALRVGGTVLDRETESGLFRFCTRKLHTLPDGLYRLSDKKPQGNSLERIAATKAKTVGIVLIGDKVQLGANLVLAGPTVICDGAVVEADAIIDRAVIGPKVTIRAGRAVQQVLVTAPKKGDRQPLCTRRFINIPFEPEPDGTDEPAEKIFRSWPRLSYARCFKRILDVLIASVVLLLFAPVMPFIALAIKLTSPGPVFYKDKRQGLHGKVFSCLKFRTMRTGASAIQEKLRVASQVDGPQFKIADDPRITPAGRFLRETYIDEIPQFINVLLGQMSVVGPRPSPESENTLCPSWRDARLSVRPGITGLWQVRRTRKPMQDFQEWIRYDTEYVRNLSFKLDMWICWQTFKKMLDNFISQF